MSHKDDTATWLSERSPIGASGALYFKAALIGAKDDPASYQKLPCFRERYRRYDDATDSLAETIIVLLALSIVDFKAFVQGLSFKLASSPDN
ncbi:MAG TPA: hypothetical protein PKD64_10675 [Pirellulaceae bacterium]|nr:hypothetical protein [Pirellulaceae bacterium]HMO92645.1 hypothetical protein [Pirellulaceae bacterium]HMP70207.1 hypothetical protein [Pirellulaceae bacterium]